MATETREGTGPFTVEDLARTPVDHVKRELIDGWLYIEGQPADSLDAVAAEEVTSPARTHQDAVGSLYVACRAFADAYGGWAAVAPMDVQLTTGRAVQPDVLYVGPGDADQVVDRVGPGTVPRLVVEVSSPSTRSHDLVRKRRVYEEAGIPEFWFVDLAARWIATYVLGDDGYPAPTIHERGATITSSALPGLTVTVASVLP